MLEFGCQEVDILGRSRVNIVFLLGAKRIEVKAGFIKMFFLNRVWEK